MLKAFKDASIKPFTFSSTGIAMMGKDDKEAIIPLKRIDVDGVSVLMAELLVEDLIDWSAAPKDATHWIMSQQGAIWAKANLTEVTCFSSSSPEYVESLSACDHDLLAPSFGIKFYSKDIIVKRPSFNE